MTQLLSKLFQYVLTCCAKYHIDESHGLPHAMNILLYANKIYEEEVLHDVQLKDQEAIVYIAAILHDMCDKKYMNETDGMNDIQAFLKDTVLPFESASIRVIVSTMSYSKVKVHGYPQLGLLQKAYHIVREADLLCAYEYERCLVYNMKKTPNTDIVHSIANANTIFKTRVLKHLEDNLFVTSFGKRESIVLHEQSIQRMEQWNRMLNKNVWNQ